MQRGRSRASANPNPGSTRRPALVRWFGALATIAALFAAPSASASAATATTSSTSEARQREAEARYQAGVAAYSAGRYKDAVDRFLEADALLPSAALSYNTALAYENLLDTAGALRFYRDFLRRAPSSNNASEVQRRVRELEAELASRDIQQITVRSDPPGATVFIDDRPAGVTPWTGELKPGVHELVLSLRGYADARRELQLLATRALDVNVVLATAGASEPETAPPAPARRVVLASTSDQAEAKRGFGAWPWVTLGVGGAALVSAGVFELLRRDAEEEARNEPVQRIYAERLDTMQSHQTTARILGITGGVLVLAGGALLVLSPSGEAEPARQGTLACGPGGCVGSFRAKF